MATTAREPHVVIVGGGFGGLNAAKALRDAPVRVTLIDRTNHHLFQPLLYQVATASLSPADIAVPIRSVLSRQRNVRVLLGEAEHHDVGAYARRIEKHPRGLRQSRRDLLRVRVILGQPIQVVIERVQPGGAKDPDLAHRPPQHPPVTQHALDEFAAAGEE